MIFSKIISTILVTLLQATTILAKKDEPDIAPAIFDPNLGKLDFVNATFINPPVPDDSTGKLSFVNGTNVTLEWSTNSKLFDINVVGVISGKSVGNTIALLEGASNRTNLQWLVNVDPFNLKGSVEYHTEMYIRDSLVPESIPSQNFTIVTSSAHDGPKVASLVAMAIGMVGIIFL